MTREEEIEKLREKIDILLKWGYSFHFMTPGESARGSDVLRGIKEMEIQPYAKDDEIMSAVNKAIRESDSFYNILYDHIQSKTDPQS